MINEQKLEERLWLLEEKLPGEGEWWYTPPLGEAVLEMSEEQEEARAAELDESRKRGQGAGESG